MNIPRLVPFLCLFSSVCARPLAAQCDPAPIFASNLSLSDAFGASLAAGNGVAFVGAPFDDDAVYNAGAVYLFEAMQSAANSPGSTSWVETEKFTACSHGSCDPGAYNGFFGAAVAAQGSTLVVGAPDTSLMLAPPDARRSAGKVHVFEKPGPFWVKSVELIAAAPKRGDRFGKTVAISGDTLAIGTDPQDGAGRIHVFERTANLWTLVAVLTSPGGFDPSNDDRFGRHFALDGDKLVVGAPGADQLHPDSGALYVYERQAGSFALTEVVASPAASGLGERVSLDGDDLFAATASAVFVFEFDRVAGGWRRTQMLAVDGLSVSLSGETALVGSRGSNGVGVSEAWVFRLQDGAWERTNTLSFASPVSESTVSVVGFTALVGGSLVPVGPAGQLLAFSIPDPANASCFALNYCEATPNSTGFPALLSASGSNLVSSNDLILTANGAPASATAQLFLGMGAVQAPFGPGFLCVDPRAGGLARLATAVANPFGTVSWSLDLNANSGTAMPAIAAGSTWFFQALYTDAAAGAGAFNTTDGTEVSFFP